MATLLDDVIGIKLETTYNTPATVDRFYPMLDGTNGSWDPDIRQGQGITGGNGRHAAMASRRFLGIGQGVVTVMAELESKAGGVLFGAALGTTQVTAITGGSQQVFHDGIAGVVLPSYTIQLVKVLNSGATWVETYAGCTATKVKIDQPQGGNPTIEVTFDARSLSTATAAATPTYSLGTLFDYSQASSVSLGGAFTAPTTTALAAVATPFADVLSYTIDLDQAAALNRRVLGGRNQPIAGMPVGQFQAKIEFNATTVPAAFIAGTKLPFQATYTTTETLGAGFTQLQVAVPNLAITGKLPDVKPGEVRVIDFAADILWDGSNKDLYLTYRTTDTAA